MERPNQDIPETWPEWTDQLGQVYRSGDFVAYASISGKSPQMVFARVLQIRRLDGKYEEITETVWVRDPDNPKRGEYGMQIKKPSCKVKVMPLLSARGFWRSEEARPVTLSIPDNVIKVEPRPEWTVEHIVDDLAKLREELT